MSTEVQPRCCLAAGATGGVGDGAEASGGINN